MSSSPLSTNHHNPAARLAAPVLALAVLAGCAGSHRAAAGTFEPSASAGCMNHQVTAPTSADRRATEDIARRLTVLRYYTAHGQQPFCDGRPATATDLAWMQVYVAGGAQRTFVARWLGP